MYRALPLSRPAVSITRGSRVTRRRFTTETPPPPPPKKKRRVRNVLLATVTLTGGFYVGSLFVAFHNQRYYDFFERVPLGPTLIEYGEVHNWDTLTPRQLFISSKETAVNLYRVIWNKLSGVSEPTETEKSVESERLSAKAESYKQYKERLKSLRTNVDKSKNAVAIARHQADQFSEGLDELVRKAEAALSPIKPPPADATPTQPAKSPPTLVDGHEVRTDIPVYTTPLPIGFEPPPGYSKPPPQKRDANPPPVEADTLFSPLPLIAPAVSQFGASEPVIFQLASTIDNLASFLSSSPIAASKADDLLETAKVDLTKLASRLDRIREEARSQLEEKLDEQAKDYAVKLLELEMESQDKLDSQEGDFRKFFDEEKTKFLHAYREKLDRELRTQTELINERLKAEVIAQGIEMQRRWIREIKVRVEQERGGRLAKLDELAADIKRLERLALDNSSYLDENIRVHALWSTIRALNNIVEAPVRRPFRDELRVLRHITAVKEEPLVVATLESLESSDVPDIGIEPFADLASWFSSSVAPRIVSVALVPDQNAGVLSHLASHFLSPFRFKRQGLVPGSDVLSVLARAEYYINEKDLDSAARELNQLKGTAKVLLSEWLDAVRRRLEVLQALQIIQAQATLASLTIVGE